MFKMNFAVNLIWLECDYNKVSEPYFTFCGAWFDLALSHRQIHPDVICPKENFKNLAFFFT